MFRIGTLFSGIGAPEQAAKRVYGDHEIVFACEIDKFARKSYESNYNVSPDHFYNDINDMSGKQYRGEVDMIVGGSPCQDFSIAGLRAGVDGHRGELIWQFFRIINEASPTVFIYENVKGMVSDKGGKTLKDFLEVFLSIGYYCHAEVLNTKDYGIPQNRERIYVIGFLDHEQYYNFSYAPKIKLTKRLRDALESDVDEKYYLADKAIAYMSRDRGDGRTNWDMGMHYEGDADVGSCLTANIAKGLPYGVLKEPKISVIGKLGIKGNDSIKRVCSQDGLCPTIMTCQGGVLGPKVFVPSAVKCGYEVARKGDIINFSVPNSKTRRWRVGKQVAQCLDTACKQGVYADRIRKLTPRECLRLQDFPDTFKQVVSDTQLYKQAGNSMSVNVVEMIMRQIEKAKAGESGGLFGTEPTETKKETA